jgi:fibronectin-binding autotransporter adhesin
VVQTVFNPNDAFWGGAIDGSWNTVDGSNASNWLNGPAGTDTLQKPSATTNVYLSATSAGNLTTTLGEDFAINSLNFTGTGTAATGVVTISGNTLTLNATSANGNVAGTGLTVASGSGAHTLASNVALGADQTWGNFSSNSLTVSGAISGAHTLALSGDFTFTGTAANTGSGTTTLTTGTLQLGKTAGVNALGGDLVVGVGGTAQWLQNNQVGDSAHLTVSGGGTVALGGFSETVGLVSLTGGSITGTTGVLTGSAYAVESGTVSAILGGAGVALTKTTGGTVTLSGVNTYTGLTTISDGGLVIASSGSLASGNALSVGASGTADFANVGQTLGAVSNANTTADALHFNAITGTVTLASLSGAGSTRFDSNANVTGGIAEGMVTVAGLLTANISGGTVSTATLSAGSIAGGTTTVSGVATVGTLTSGTVNLNGSTSAITTLNGGTVNLGASTTLSVSSGTSAGVTTGSGGQLVKAGAGALTLTGVNTYSGTTTVTGGTLTLNASGGAALANTSAVVIGTGGTVALGAANQITSSANLTLNGGTLALHGFNQSLGSLDLDAASTLDLSGSADLVFADSSAQNWNSALLSIRNFSTTANSLRFGTTSGGLDTLQLGLIRFVEFGNSVALIDADGFLAPLSVNYSNVGSTDIEIATPITGTTTVDQSGTGTTTLTASASTPNTSTGAATVSAGTLVIGTAAGGNWAGDVTVSGSGILKGRGDIGGAVIVNAGGTYSPGNSPAIQNVATLIVNSGGSVVIELDGATAGNGAGFHDQVVSAGAVNLTGGTLTGATIFAGFTGYVPALGAGHTIITGSSITGTFGDHTFATADNAAGLSFMPVYNATALTLFTVPRNYATALANLTANQTQVGNALESLRPDFVEQRGTPGATDVLFNRLVRLDAAGLLAAYNDLNPEKFSALSATSFQSASVMNGTLQQRSAELRRNGPAAVSLNGVARSAPVDDYAIETVIEDGVHYQIAKAKPRKRIGYFASASGAFTDVEAASERNGYSARAGAASCGFDYALSDHHSVGLVVGQYYSDAAFAGDSGSAQTSTQRVGLFYDYHRDGFYINTSVSVGVSAYETQRKLGFLEETARGETDGLSVGGQVALGYDFKIGNYIMGPKASVSYDHARINGFAETGSAAGLSVGAQQADSVVTNLGVHISRPFTWKRIGWIPEASFGVSRQHYNANSIDARFGAGGAGFTVKPQAVGSEFVNPGVSLTAILTKGWSVRLSYDGIINNETADHRFNLNVGKEF